MRALMFISMSGKEMAGFIFRIVESAKNKRHIYNGYFQNRGDIKG